MFWGLIPEVHREEDSGPDGDGSLALFADALRDPFDRLRRKIQVWGDLRDPLEVRTQYDEVECLRLGKQYTPIGDLDRSGLDGSVVSIPTPPTKFVSRTGKWADKDIGKTLVVSGSSIARNNRSVLVSKVLDPQRINTDPALDADAGLLKWELREKVAVPTDRIIMEVRAGDLGRVAPGWVLNDGFSDFRILGRYRFNPETGLMLSEVKQFGYNMTVTGVGAADTTVSIPTASFSQSHVGNAFITRRSTIDSNNVFSYVKAVLSSTSIQIGGRFEIPDPDNGELEWELRDGPVYGHIILFGINLPKGIIEQEGTAMTIDSTGVSTSVVSAPAGNFAEGDVGKRLTILGADEGANNNTMGVTEVLSLSELVVDEVLTLPEANNGSLRWELRTATGTDCVASG
jgi:hypothetical protein